MTSDKLIEPTQAQLDALVESFTVRLEAHGMPKGKAIERARNIAMVVATAKFGEVATMLRDTWQCSWSSAKCRLIAIVLLREWVRMRDADGYVS
jgi:hypothetical protein